MIARHTCRTRSRAHVDSNESRNHTTTADAAGARRHASYRLQCPSRRPILLQDIQADLPGLEVHIWVEYFGCESGLGRDMWVAWGNVEQHVKPEDMRAAIIVSE